MSIDKIAEDISRVFKPKSFQPSVPSAHESEEEMLERRDLRITAKPELLESETVTKIPVDDIFPNRRFPALGIDEGCWRWTQGTHDIVISNAGWITTWSSCPRLSREVARDWAVIIRNKEILNPYLPSSIRNRVYALSTRGRAEQQIDRLVGTFMQTQLRSAMQSAMSLSEIHMDEIDGALRARSHKQIDDLGKMYSHMYRKTNRLAVFVVKRPRMQTVVRQFGLDGYADDRAFYVGKMMQQTRKPNDYVRSQWIRECDPRISRKNQVTLCWILTPRNLVFRIETFYWMFKNHGSEIAKLVAADSYQNGGGYLPLHQTKAHEQFSMSSGFREMLQAKLSLYIRMISPESGPWEAYGWGA